MNSKILIFITIFISMALLTTSAEARRFGGGRSFGKSWSSPAHRSSSFSNATSKNRSSLFSGKRSMLKGAFMGLLAGGLLGSLLSGGAFNGFQGMDFLLLAGAAFFLFRMFQKRKMAGNQGQSNASFEQQQAQNNEHSFMGKQEGMGGSHHNAHSYPSWFNEKKFVEGAKSHFMTLQNAWDNNDLSTIQTYCVSELYQKIENERVQLQGAQQTQVLSLKANLLDVIDDGAFVIAGVEFIASIRSNNEATENVREIWSIQHAKNHGNGDWLIVGIDQK